MILEYTAKNLLLPRGECRYEFTPSGDVRRFCMGDIMVNRLTPGSLDNGVTNLWLRIYSKNGRIRFIPLLGKQSTSTVAKSDNCLRFSGQAFGVSYAVIFHAHHCGWLWEVILQGSGQLVDVVYGQDVSMGSIGAVLENDLYICQYLGHTPLKGQHGFIICTRQNMPQNGKNPYLQLGMLEGYATAYSTDATQFFGLDYKKTNRPKGLSGNLACSNYQYECAYPALQSHQVQLDGECRMVFYGFLMEHHPKAITEAVPEEILCKSLRAGSEEKFRPVKTEKLANRFGGVLASEPMEQAQLEKLYPNRRLEEYKDGQLLSFFDDFHTHVVTQAKELLVERPHANIITTFINTQQVDNELITSTCTMLGQFNGQTVIGNTSKHKLLSAQRGLLNTMKQSGMRIWVKLGAEYRLLTLPAVFEIGLNYCRWIYLVGTHQLTVETFATAHSTDIVTKVTSTASASFIVTCQLVMGSHEYQQPIDAEIEPGLVKLRPLSDSQARKTYPDLFYQLHMPKNTLVSDDRVFFDDGQPRDSTLLTLQIPESSSFTLRIHGTLDLSHKKYCLEAPDLEVEKKNYLELYSKLLRKLSFADNEERRLQILNETIYWYAHNALVHFAVPHGLEQPGGAAWGTRDVCQGPFEFFMSTGHFPLMRDVLITIFRHQDKRSGQWPQWFMFDRYTDAQRDCHGDVVLWPLKCVGDYLAATGDLFVLEERIEYADTDETETLLEHISLAVNAIEARFLPGTALISYAGGDWDDTLQPCSQELQESLVSSWTQALAYQVLDHLGRALPSPMSQRCSTLAEQTSQAFRSHLVVDGVIAGFVYRLPDGSFKPMLHPRDEDTGIHLRLLPMTRSIIAGLSSQQLAKTSMELIEEKLHCPDGVRLMDHPARYNGGESRLFRRAEQAANVGREISLQYTHAHIRYIEALCRLGLGDQVWEALFEVNPICLTETVKNAQWRQSNLYFSSSDGDFSDRWIYDQECGRLLTGQVAVKGGWRLYSSGPGIYFRQLLSGLLGLRSSCGWLEIDPVLPVRKSR